MAEMKEMRGGREESTNKHEEIEEESINKDEGIVDDPIKEEPPPAPAITPLPHKKVLIGAMVSLKIVQTKKKYAK